jgi:hypothetical protein
MFQKKIKSTEPFSHFNDVGDVVGVAVGQTREED